MKKHKALKRILIAVLVVILCLLSAFGLYVSNYYHADQTAENVMNGKVDDVDITTGQDGTVLFWPKDGTDTGLIFYPGGKVEYTAYAPLLKEYAENGIACILIKMPFNLAVFDINAADDVYNAYPEIHHWYIGGHSLGGAMAAYYASRNAGRLDGLVLLGAYSTEDLSDTNMKAVLIDGSNDQIINHEKVKESENNYPQDTSVYTIDGGNHCQFGSYGFQKGDGKASIPAEKQWEETVKDTLEVIDQ